MGTIADTIRSALAAGKTNEEVLAAVKAAHPSSNTTSACVSYYRSKAKKEGGTPAPRQSKAIAKPASGHGYAVKGVKTFRGNEGYGFNATLYKDGKAIAFVIDDANGGCYSYEWKDDAERVPFVEYAKQRMTEVTMEHDDALVASLVEDVLLERDAAKLVKGKVAILKGGKVYTVKPNLGDVTPQFIALVASKNPGAVVLNGKSTAELVAVLKSMQH